MKRLSGAHIHRLPWITIKRGGEDVASQGQYMSTLPHCAKVYSIGRTWYAMETLDRWDEWWPVTQAFGMLEEIWDSGDQLDHPPDWYCLLQGRLATWSSPLIKYLDDASQAIDADDENESPARLHGDPTWENTLYDLDAKVFKFIDPLLPRPYLPAHPIVDIAKLAQTALGWETQLYGWNVDRIHKYMFVERAYDRPIVREWLWFWTALCFERIRQRSNDMVTISFCEWQIETLIESKQIHAEWRKW